MVHTSKITRSFSEIKWQFNNITFKCVHRLKYSSLNIWENHIVLVQFCLNWSQRLCLTRLDKFTFFGTFCDNQYCDRPLVLKVVSIQTIHFEWKKLSRCILYKSLYNVLSHVEICTLFSLTFPPMKSVVRIYLKYGWKWRHKSIT